MAVQEGYSPRNRTERVISAGRLFLSAFLALSLARDASQMPYSPAAYTLTIWFLLYSASVTVLTWSRGVTTRGVPLATHLIDLVAFTALVYLTGGPESPLFVYFVFATVCGAIRWQGRGAMLTGSAVLIAYIGITYATTAFGVSEDFHSGRFIARCAHLGIVAALLGYLGTYQRRLQREIAGLAAWPRRLPTQGSEGLQEVLNYAADLLRAPRAVLVWTEGDEPSLRVASKEGTSS